MIIDDKQNNYLKKEAEIIAECQDLEDEEDMPKSARHQTRQHQQVSAKWRRARRKISAKMRHDANAFNLSFCGCGFLGIYHVGVASCFHEYAPQLSMHKISGSSAGALVAVSHICGNLQLAYATTDILRVAIDARARTLGPFHPAFDINATVREALDRGLPEDVHLKANGKLHVSLTRVYDGANVVISEFDSKEDVIQVLLCSCFIPIWSGLKAPKYKGVTYIDGGFSNNLLTLDDKTVTVSPFSGEADICPQDNTFNLLQISLSNTSFSISPDNLYRLSHALLPPPPEVLSSLCEQGFADGIRFLQRMKLISCTKCLDIRSSSLAGSFLSLSDLNNDNNNTSSQCKQEEEFISDDFIQHCDECVSIREKAASRNKQLPKQFSDRIRDACDTVNKSLSNWIYSHRPIKYLSYLAAPYYLPLEISLALVGRCWKTLPSIRAEISSCFSAIIEFLAELIRRAQQSNKLLELSNKCPSTYVAAYIDCSAICCT